MSDSINFLFVIVSLIVHLVILPITILVVANILVVGNILVVADITHLSLRTGVCCYSVDCWTLCQ